MGEIEQMVHFYDEILHCRQHSPVSIFVEFKEIEVSRPFSFYLFILENEEIS